LLMDSDNAYIYGQSGTPFEQTNLASGTVHYLVSDALGSVRGFVSSGGSLSASTSYDAWGNPETSGGLSADTPFGYAGGYTDPTGLVYLIGRYYDPTTGQFLSVDPLVDETGQPYAYTGDDPVNMVDSLGTITCPSWLGAGCGVVTDVQNGISAGVKAAASWVTNNAGTIATITSALATIAYVSCAVTEGVGCGVGLALSTISTSVSGLEAVHACTSGSGCAAAAANFGISLVATVSGIGLEKALASSLNVENAYSEAIFRARQAGVVGATLNGLEALLSESEKLYDSLAAAQACQT
jgi:RHS repeat-associated protein